MAYTKTDLESVESAILKLATGERVVSVSISGTRIDYGQADLPQLRVLRSEIESSLSSGSGGRTLIISTSKGL